MIDFERTRAWVGELAGLNDGWLNGQGFAPTSLAATTALSLAHVLSVEHWIDVAYLYPLESGGLQYELQGVNGREAEVEISPGGDMVVRTEAEDGDVEAPTFGHVLEALAVVLEDAD